MNWPKRSWIVMLTLASCILAYGWLNGVAASAKQKAGEKTRTKAVQQDNAASAAAFESIMPVLRHPRCMNCHSQGDFPRQGDDGHRHTMNVRRGREGQGVTGLRCSTCHQDHNLAGEHMPPGAPDWHLPSAGNPMIWAGLSARQLCELLKDPVRNGHRTIDGIVKHMNTPLVLWGLAPW